MLSGPVLDELSTALYQGTIGCGMNPFYDSIQAPRAQQAVLFALEHRGATPPVNMLHMLWDKHGRANPYPFFVPAVFKHTDLWVKIIRDLAAADMWMALCCYTATQRAATEGHLRCSSIYLDGLLRCTDSDRALRMGICYVDCNDVEPRHVRRMVELMREGYRSAVLEWLERLRGEQLVHIADDLLAMDGTDALLLKMVGLPGFADAVQRSTGTSPVCLLTRPVQELTDDEFRSMVRRYMPSRGSVSLHWHTDALRRGDPICPTRFTPDRMYHPVHRLLHTIAMGHELPHDPAVAYGLPHDPHLWMTALRDHPDACATLGKQLDTALGKHRRQMDTDVQLLCLPVPKALAKHIALFM